MTSPFHWRFTGHQTQGARSYSGCLQVQQLRSAGQEHCSRCAPLCLPAEADAGVHMPLPLHAGACSRPEPLQQ